MSRALRFLPKRASRGSLGPIGLELTPDEVRVVQMEGVRNDGRPRAAVRVAEVFERTSSGDSRDEVDPSELRSMLRRAGTRGRRVVSVPPESRTRLLVLNFEAPESGDEVDTVLSLIDERVDEPLDSYVIDYLTLRTARENQRERSVLAAVAPKRDAIGFLESLRASGLGVEALEIPPLAVHRLLSESGALGQDETVVAIRILPTRSELLVQSGRRLVLFRTIDVGEEAIVAAASKALEVDRDAVLGILARFGVRSEGARARTLTQHAAASDADVAGVLAEILEPVGHALVEDIQRAGVYVASQFRGAGLDRVLLLGRATAWPGLADWIGGLLSIPTVAFDASALLAETSRGSLPTEGPHGGDLSVALGLALRGTAA